MLQYGKRSLLKFIDQVNGCIDIEQVVVRDFLSVNLVEHSFQISVEVTLLMRVLAVAQSLLIIGRATECRTFFAIEVVEDG